MKNSQRAKQIPLRIHVQVDPLNEFTHVRPNQLLEACGYLPQWVVNPAYFHLPLREALDAQYCCGLYEMEGSVSIRGIYTYPGDPDLHPFLLINREDETFYMYRSAIVAIVGSDGSTFVTRMD